MSEDHGRQNIAEKETKDHAQTNPFNLRPIILQNMCNWSKTTSKSTAEMILRSKGSSNTRALEILRKVIQDDFTRDVKSVLDGYVNKFMQPAIKNIRENKEHVSHDDLNNVCRKMIEQVNEACFPTVSGFESHCRIINESDCSDDTTASVSLTYRRSKRNKKKTIGRCSRSSTPGNLNDFAIFKQPEPIIIAEPSLTEMSQFVVKSKIRSLLIEDDELRVLIDPALALYECDGLDIDWLVSVGQLTEDDYLRETVKLVNVEHLLQLATRSCRASLNLKLTGLTFHVPGTVLQKMVGQASTSYGITNIDLLDNINHLQ